MKKIFNDEYINITVELLQNNLKIMGTLLNASNFNKRVLIAPSSHNNLMSYSGSFLPFPNEDIALENTKNIFIIQPDGIINTSFSYPNSYYSPDGYNKIKSPIILMIDGKKIIYELDDLCPLKTIRDRVRGDPRYYAVKEILLPVATAENNMINYANAKFTYNIA
jgi:hypothetical protein